MGARLPPVERPRRGGLKCEFCGRAVPNAEALRSHQNSLHSSALKKKEFSLKKKLKPSKVLKAEPRKELLKKVAPKLAPKINKKKPSTEKNKEITTKAEKILKPEIDKPVAAIAKSGLEKESVQMLKMEAESKTESNKPIKRRKIEFQCPKCSKLFPALFSAQKHIQKHHPNSKDDSSNTQDMKPIQLEHCFYCNEKLPSPHECPNRPSGLAMIYECVGCEQQFSSNKLFDVHIVDIHGDMLECLLFPSEEEFRNWKEQMEAQTNCKYTVMGQYNAKQVHRCCCIADDSTDDVVRFCPSTIISTDVTKGIQVHFYLDHHGHKHHQYELGEKYKSYTIKDLIQQAGCKTPHANTDDSDLYLQFNMLMESIVLDAAKINIATLKILIAKALDMTSILTQYDEDEETSFGDTRTLSLSVNKKEDTITKALESLRSSKRNKRSAEENGTAEKRLKVSDKKTPAKIKNSSFSLADEKDSEKILKELDSENVKTKGPKGKAKEEEIENVKSNLGKKANQSPKVTSMSPQLSFNDTYKDFIKNNVPAPKPAVKKRNVVKTKMGQFKPSLSPKKDASKRNSIGNTQDIQYEVKEQENDCNILILKI